MVSEVVAAELVVHLQVSSRSSCLYLHQATWVKDKQQADEVVLIEATQGVGVVDFHQTCSDPDHVVIGLHSAADKAVERYVA